MEIIAIPLVLIVLIVVLFVLSIWQTNVAKRQHETVTNLSPARVRDIVENSFTKLFWAPVSGPGDINMRRRTIRDTGLTVSVDIDSSVDGKTHVQAWMSAFTTRYGMLADAKGMGLPKKIIAKIDEAA